MKIKCMKQEQLEASEHLRGLIGRRYDDLCIDVERFVRNTAPELGIHCAKVALGRIEAIFDDLKTQNFRLKCAVAVLGGLIAGNVLAWIVGLIF